MLFCLQAHDNMNGQKNLRQGINGRMNSQLNPNRPRNNGNFHHHNMNQLHNNFYDNSGMGYNNGMEGFNYYNNGNGNPYGGPIRNNFQYGNKTHHNNRYNPLNNPSTPGQQLEYNEPFSYDSAGASNGYGPYNGSKPGFHPNNFNPQFNLQFPQNNGRMNQQQDQQQHPGFTLFVYNIGTNTDEQMLRNLFTKFGHVLRTNVIRKGNESKGFGFVAMSSHRDALSAIAALNGYTYNGKQLQVSFKK